MLDKVYVVHFSPAGNTRKAALMLAGELAVQVEEYDLTLPLGERRSFAPSDVVIAAGPVYGGRLPGVMAERLSRVQGNGAWFISLAVYGNRAYEDALAELDDRMEQQGFSRLASAALVAQHSIVTQLAAGRPDGQDRREIAEFAGEILHKLKTLAEGNRPEEKATPGNRPYKSWKPMQAVPQIAKDCIRCGLCAQKCPVEAITRRRSDADRSVKCILCMRALPLPGKSENSPAPVTEMLSQKLAPFLL